MVYFRKTEYRAGIILQRWRRQISDAIADYAMIKDSDKIRWIDNYWIGQQKARKAQNQCHRR